MLLKNQQETEISVESNTLGRNTYFYRLIFISTDLSCYFLLLLEQGSALENSVSLLKPKIIFFQNYIKFDETKFLADLKNKNFSFTSADPNENYLFLTNSFSKTVEKHVPLKQKTFRGNHAPFVSKELR